MSRSCYGCGAKLQDTDKNKSGYVSDADNEKHLLCQRCFRMKHHNEYHSHYLDSKHFEKIIKDTIKPKSLVVLVVDLFDISSSLSLEISRIVKNNPIIIVGSKRDLVLKSVKDHKIVTYLYKEAQKYKLDVQDIILSSATKKYGVDNILDSIFKYYKKRDVFIVGITNVGKSSIVNSLINSIEKSNYQITISNYPGTTLDSIKIAIDDNVSLYDTPGLVIKEQMIHHVNLEDYKYLEIKKEVKARIYQLNDQQSLFFGGLACFSFISGQKTGFNCFMNNELEIHRTKLERAENLFDDHFNDDLLVPKTNDIEKFSDFKIHRFTFNKDDGKKDIVILGLGWITFEAVDQMIEIAVSKHVKIVVRDAII